MGKVHGTANSRQTARTVAVIAAAFDARLTERGNGSEWLTRYEHSPARPLAYVNGPDDLSWSPSWYGCERYQDADGETTITATVNGDSRYCYGAASGGGTVEIAAPGLTANFSIRRGRVSSGRLRLDRLAGNGRYRDLTPEARQSLRWLAVADARLNFRLSDAIRRQLTYDFPHYRPHSRAFYHLNDQRIDDYFGLYHAATAYVRAQCWPGTLWRLRHSLTYHTERAANAGSAPGDATAYRSNATPEETAAFWANVRSWSAGAVPGIESRIRKLTDGRGILATAPGAFPCCPDGETDYLPTIAKRRHFLAMARFAGAHI